MKAWSVTYGDEWYTLMHAATRGKAIQRAMRQVCDMDNDYIGFSARRLPGLDDKPINYDNAKGAGFEYLDDIEGQPIPSEEFVNDCPCGICKP
jgi:hypothetical protein